nr:hypothetical protein Josef01_02j05_31 [uncultured archaeon]
MQNANTMLQFFTKISTQHNFVKPHMALEGKTPAEAVDIDVKGSKELIEKRSIRAGDRSMVCYENLYSSHFG